MHPQGRLLLVAAAASLTGCADPPTEPPIRPAEPGWFAVELSGSLSASLEGPARITTVISTRRVVLQAGDGSYELSISPGLFSDTDFDFQAGTYQLGPLVGLGTVDIVLRTPADESAPYYFAVGGQLRITESRPERIVGEIDVDAIDEAAGSGQVRVRGAFHATADD